MISTIITDLFPGRKFFLGFCGRLKGKEIKQEKNKMENSGIFSSNR